ncbi:MAG: methyltransferase domain-containing protein [bacterium]|nr:methyltransferase domain-containing protein [bacterium]
MTGKILDKARSIIRNFCYFRCGAWWRAVKKRPLPQNKDGRVLIHIGCGEFNDPKYINIDSRPGWHIHYVDNIENCRRIFQAGYADLIYACHVLEHVSHLKLKLTLQGLQAVLKDGGVLRLSVPNFDTIYNIYTKKKKIGDIIAPLMGGQGYPGNFHFAVFNEAYLKDLLLQSGFTKVLHWTPENTPDHGFNDWSGRTIKLYGEEWPISLNLEAIK